MTLFPKMRYAKQAIRSISTHDDEALEDRQKLLAELKAFIDEEIDRAVVRDHEKRIAAEPPAESKAED